LVREVEWIRLIRKMSLAVDPSNKKVLIIIILDRFRLCLVLLSSQSVGFEPVSAGNLHQGILK
jgi:hypothetical protein